MSHSDLFPLISIITLVYNGQDNLNLDRAISSVFHQTFADWELLLIDDCSTDDFATLLESFMKQDARIHVLRMPEYGGRSAARNVGLKNARGEYVCYLDQEDEYYADYLATIVQWHAQSDVLAFPYDVIDEDSPDACPRTWRTEVASELLFVCPLAAPIGIAHRRSLIDQVGGFNELLATNEEAELWRRFARAGVEFRFLPQKSGLHRQRSKNSSQTARLTSKQMETFRANLQSGKLLFGDRPATVRRPNIRKIAFASPHSLIDSYSGAAIATSHALQMLQEQGFECQAFCGSYLDIQEECSITDMLAQQGIPYEARNAKIDEYEAPMVFAHSGKVPVTIFTSSSTRGQWLDEAEVKAFIAAYNRFLEQTRPDVVLTFGGDPVSLCMMELTKRYDIPVVFALHNFGYRHPKPFLSVDYAVVPSEFARQYYWNTLGLACQKLPNVIDWQRVEAPDRQPRYATFVNPEPVKGVFVFARIVEELARRRPDIPFLIVESRGGAKSLAETGVDLNKLTNIRWMKHTSDPRDFYRRTKLILMPSLWNESFPLVAAEAMLNGIPVLGSSRGGIPEVLGSSGFIFDIPDCYNPLSKIVPSTEEVEQWLETIIRLWDDDGLYRQWSESARREAGRWHPKLLAVKYREFFSDLTHQPGPPIVPKELVNQTLDADRGRLRP